MGHTRYELFSQVEEISKMTKTGENEYSKFMPSGRLAETHYDYGRGFYDVSIFYNYYPNKTLPHHACRVWFGTIDDGDFGSWNYFDTKEEAIKMVEKVAELFDTIQTLPSHKDLNKMFEKMGVYFDHE